MEKVLKFDFYEVVTPAEEATPFETILQNADQLQGVARTFDNGSYHVQLVSLHRRGGYFLGDPCKVAERSRTVQYISGLLYDCLSLLNGDCGSKCLDASV
ncbi:MAG TPA: hypothetical protein VI298_05340 [Geobacteraceae bacterium]